MKKNLLLLAILATAFTSRSQVYYPDGTAISTTATLTDLNNVSHDLFTMTNAGKHVIIDLSATWCGICWGYHQSEVLDRYYNLYGPTGTSEVKDAEVFLYEVDNSTDMADLQGTGTNTQGDWITGTTHPICDPANSNSVVLKFVQPGQTYGLPAIFVVCEDKKLYKLSNSLTNEVNLRDYIAGKCGISPNSTTEIMDLDFSYDLFPNPANEATKLRLNLDKPNDVSYSLENCLGQSISATNNVFMASGITEVDFNTGNLANGIYLLKLTVGHRHINARISVQH